MRLDVVFFVAALGLNGVVFGRDVDVVVVVVVVVDAGLLRPPNNPDKAVAVLSVLTVPTVAVADGLRLPPKRLAIPPVETGGVSVATSASPASVIIDLMVVVVEAGLLRPGRPKSDSTPSGVTVVVDVESPAEFKVLSELKLLVRLAPIRRPTPRLALLNRAAAMVVVTVESV